MVFTYVYVIMLTRTYVAKITQIEYNKVQNMYNQKNKAQIKLARKQDEKMACFKNYFFFLIFGCV